MGPASIATLMIFGLGCCVAAGATSTGEKTLAAVSASQDWPVYGGQNAQDHYSSLAQINKKNVKDLAVAWKFDSGEKGGMETNPLVVGRILYAFTPSQKVIALDARSGKLLWEFESGIDGQQPDRGLAYWADGKESRIFAGIMNFLYALDPVTGKPILSFGEEGRIDLRKGLGGDYKLQSVVLTSPGIIYKDLIIVGGRNPEMPPSPPGDIRAFDVHSGVLRWRFRTIPHPGEAGYNTWPKDAWKTAGAANNWAGMALDVKRGMVYIPTGSAVPDFFGAKRIGDDLFADSLVALNAETGKLVWYFQGVHHDLWDRDFPAPPVLITIRRNGKTVDALAQTTKQGWLFVLDRTTGKPLFPVEERRYPASTVPGEVSSPTQPYPLEPAPYSRQMLTEDMLTNRTPAAHAWAVQQFHRFINKGPFTPLSVGKPTVVFPGFDGGGEWGGPAADPNTGVIYVNANDIAWTGTMIKNNPSADLGLETYRSQCAVCHGVNRAGSPPEFPSLIGVGNRLSREQIVSIIHHGQGRMPPFPDLQNGTLKALLGYLQKGKSAAGESSVSDAIVAMGGDGYVAPEESGSTHAVPAGRAAGARLYTNSCAVCHGATRRGNPPTFPSLIAVSRRMTAQQVASRIRHGKGAMPPFPQLTTLQVNELVQFLDRPTSTMKPKTTAIAESSTSPDWMAYLFTGYDKFYDPDGYPAVTPPWGTLSAIDLNTGKYLWKKPLGEYPELAAKGMANTGTENYGGPVVTAGGLVFIGATVFDSEFRAFDSSTGELLWQTRLPAAGMATPATYMVEGKQYVVIAAGGGKIHESPAGKLPTGGTYVAFALPAIGECGGCPR